MSAVKPAPATIAREALARLRASRDPAKAVLVQRYFKETVRSYGLTSGQVREIARDLGERVKVAWSAEDAADLCEILLRERELEAKAVATLILLRFRKSAPRSLFRRVEAWLAADRLDSWASVDVLCPELMAALLARYPDLTRPLRGWARHPNRWVKRAAAVSFLKLAKRPEWLDPIYEVARALLPADDDLVRKANGWLLREAGKTSAERLETFLLEHGPRLPRTTVRYAIERFPEERRRELLARTRPDPGARSTRRRMG